MGVGEQQEQRIPVILPVYSEELGAPRNRRTVQPTLHIEVWNRRRQDSPLISTL